MDERRNPKSVFSQFDKDGSGAISVSELGGACAKMGMPNVPPAKLKQIIAEVDSNGDGEVDFGEFLIVLEKAKHAESALSNIVSKQAETMSNELSYIRRAASIKAGGCIPPPTPKNVDRLGGLNLSGLANGLLNNLNDGQRYGKSTDRRHQAYTTSTEAQMMGYTYDLSAEDVNRVPADVNAMGATVRDGVVQRLADPRRTGPSLFWQTSTMSQNEQVYGAASLR